MKIFRVLLICLLVLINIKLFSQSNKEEIIKARDFISYKIIDKYLMEFSQKSKDPKVRDEYNSIKNELNINSFEETFSLNKLEKLSSNFPSLVNSQIFLKIKDLRIEYLDNYSNTQISDELVKHLQNIYNESDLGIKIDIRDVKSNIENELNEISKKRQINNSLNNSNSENDVDSSIKVNSEQIEAPNFFSIDGMNIWNLISILLSLISILLIIILPKKVNSQSSSNKNQSSERVQSTVNQNSFDPNEFERRLRSSSKIAELSNEIHLLKNNPDRYDSIVATTNIKPDNNTTNNELNTHISTFYIYRPIDNYFSKSNVQSSKKDTLYKFIINSNNKNESSYELITDGSSLSPTDIAKRNETLIKPACEEENVPGDNVRNIINKRKGIAVLEGDKWVIKSKALIRYE